MNYQHLVRRALACVIAAMAIAPFTGQAAESTSNGPQSGSGFVLEEITVTANKREENLQDVAISVTALTGDDLEELNAVSFTDYAQHVPGLNFGSRGSGLSRMSLRGMQAIRNAPTVAYIVDDISQQVSSSSPDSGLFDIERVEVLRGPQGTLYGEGAVGGAIKIITKRPNLTEFEGQVGFGYASQDDGDDNTSVRGMVNIPLVSEQLGLRLVGFQRDMGGYLDVYDVSSQSLFQKEANDEKITGGRISLAWAVNDDARLTAIYSTQETKSGFSHLVNPSAEAIFGENSAWFGNGQAFEQLTIENDQLLVQLDWGLPWADLTAVVGQSTLDFDDSTPLDLALFGFPGFVLRSSVMDEWEFTSAEVRLASNNTNGIRWVVGLFYKDIERDVFASGLPDLGEPSADVLEERSQQALFGEVEYDINDKLTVAFGLRFYREKVDSNILSQIGDFVSFAGSSDADFDDVSPKLSLSYKVSEDLMFYASYGEGFRSGGVNIPRIDPVPAEFPPDYDSDQATSYELGIKSVWLDGRLRLNAAAFYNKWEDMQSELVIEGISLDDSPTVNAGEAHTSGVEFEIEALLTQGLSVMLGGAYIDARLDETFNEEFIDTNPGAVIPDGSRLENVPRKTLSASVDYERSLFDGINGFGRVDYSYRSDAISSITLPDASRTKGYGLTNLQLGLRAEAWTVVLYAENVANKNASSFNFEPFDLSWRIRPRTIGLKADYSF